MRIGTGRIFVVGGSRMGEAGVSSTREGDEVRFDQVTS